MEIQQYKKEYFPLIHKWHNDPNLSKKIGFNGVNQSLEDTENLIQKLLNDVNTEWRFLEYKDEIIGYFSLSNIDVNHSYALLHTLVGDKRYIGTRVSVLAMDNILSYAFKEKKLHRINTFIMADNPKLIRLASKYGFTQEGIQKETLKFNGQWIDIHLFRMLDYEFMPKIKEN